MPDDQHPSGGIDIQSVLTSRGLLSGASLGTRATAGGGKRRTDRPDRRQARPDLGPRPCPGLCIDCSARRCSRRRIFRPNRSSWIGCVRAFLKRVRIIPIAETDQAIVIAMADPLDDAAARAVEFAIGKPVERRAAAPDRYRRRPRQALRRGPLHASTRSPTPPASVTDGDKDSDLERLKDLASEAPVIRLVNTVITRAVEMRRVRHPPGIRREPTCASATASTACCARWRRRRPVCAAQSFRASRSWRS